VPCFFDKAHRLIYPFLSEFERTPVLAAAMMDNTPLPESLCTVPSRFANRRAEPRLACSLEVSCQPISTKGCDLWWLADIKDVSTRGVGILSTRHFEQGAYIAIQLANLTNLSSRTKVATVVRVVASDDKWFLGCTFQTPLDAAELASISLGTVC
jgi:hypothetical protein